MSRLKCAGHVERMEDENWPTSDGHKVEVKRRRVRPRMQWKDCVKRNLERIGGEWRTIATHISSWRLVIEDVVREN